MDLNLLFENWFEDYKITKTRLTKFARQHLLAVEADNATGHYDAIITATEPLLTTVENCLTDRLTKAGIEAGRVQAKDLFRETLPPKVRVLFSAVSVAYGDPSPDLTMCFPSGRTVFNARGSKDEDLNNHLNQLKNALTSRSAAVGAAHVTTITNLLTQWSALYTERWSADADTDMSVSGQLSALTALKIQLYKNVHTVAIYNLGNAEAARRMCPQGELFPSAPQSVPGACTIELTGGSGKWSGTGHASGAGIIRWYKRAAGSSVAFVDVGNGAVGEEITFDTQAAGSYEVKARGENEAGPGAESVVQTVVVT